MAFPTTFFFRSAASGVVTGNAQVHTLNTSAGTVTATDGTSFLPVASTNYNVGPGTDTVATPGGTITGTGQGWIYDTGLPNGSVYAPGTWTVNFEMQRATGGAHTGHAICEVYLVTATTTTVTKVSLIGTADSGLITLTTTDTRFGATFNLASPLTIGANQFLYAQVFWECTTVGTGNFSNHVDNPTTTVASEIITTGFVSDLPQTDDFGEHADAIGGSDMAVSADDADVVMMTYESAPVGPNTPPIIWDDDSSLVDWWEGYEEPETVTNEWSGPIQPNAPPFYYDDTYDYAEPADDGEADQTLAAEIYQPVGPNAPPFYYDDTYDYFEPADDGELEVILAAEIYDIVGRDNNPLLTVEDAWPHDDWVDDRLGEVNPEDADAQSPDNNPAQQPDDAHDWWTDEVVSQAPTPSAYFQADNLVPPVEDAWDHLDEVEDWTAEIGNLDPVGPDLPAAQGFDDDWFDEDVSDEAPADELPTDDFLSPDNNPLLAVEDAWPHDDSVEDWPDATPADALDPVGPSYLDPCQEDAWPHDDFVEDVAAEVVTDQLDPVGPDSNPAIAPYEDPWPHHDDDWPAVAHTESTQLVDYFDVPQQSDDWPWYEDVGDPSDPLHADDFDPVGPDAALSAISEDAWPHDDSAEDAAAEVTADGLDPVGPDNLFRTIEDPWSYDDDAVEDVTAEIANDQLDSVGPDNNSAQQPDDAHDWWTEEVVAQTLGTGSYGQTDNLFRTIDDDWPHDDFAEDEWWVDESQQSYVDTTFYGDDAWDWSEDVGDEPVVDEALGADVAAPPIADDAYDWWTEEVTSQAPTPSAYLQADNLFRTIEDDWPHDDVIEDEWWVDEVQLISYVDTTFYGDDAWDWSEDVGDESVADDPQNISAPDTTFYGDDAWDWEVDLGYTVAAESFQQVDYDSITYDVPDHWVWWEDVGDEPPDDDGSNVQTGNILAATVVEELPWDDADLGDEPPDDDGSNVQNNNVIAPAQSPEELPWDDQDGEDWELIVVDDANLELDPPPADPWDWDADYTDEPPDDDGSNVQNAGAAPTPPQPLEELTWDDQDGEDWELIINDFGNFELDPPPDDPWDWDVTYEEPPDDDGSNVQNGNVFAAPAQPPETDVLAFDDDGAAVSGSFESYQLVDYDSTNYGAADDWPWDEDAGDDWQAQADEAQSVSSVDTTFYGADGWDWEVDLGDEPPDDDGSNVQNNNVIILAQPPEELPWDDQDGEDWELTVIDEANLRSDIVAEDPWDHWADDAADEPVVDEAQNVSAPDATFYGDDAWAWDDHTGDDWASELYSDDFDAIATDNNPAVNIEDAWPHDDEAADEPDFNEPAVPTPPATSIAAEDPWDFAVDDTGDEQAEQVWADDGANVRNPSYFSQPPDDPWDHWAEEAADELLGTLVDDDWLDSLGLLYAADEWDWGEDVGEAFPLADDPAIASNAQPFQSQDEWGWIAEHVEDFYDEGFLISIGAVAFAQPGRTPLAVTQAATRLAVAQAATVLTITQATTTLKVTLS